jgi:hypothetical protein
MATATKPGSTLFANLCEVERGVFYATYTQGDSLPNTNSLPNYQLGKSASDAKQRFESNAYALGYDAVSWRETIVAPAFPALPKTALPKTALPKAAFRKPSAAFAARRSL